MAKVKTSIKATRLEITPAIDKYLQKRIESLTKFLRGVKSEEEIIFDIELARRSSKPKKDDDLYKAEFNISLRQKRLRSLSRKADIFKAIDDAKKEMEKELISIKEKKIMKARCGGRKIKQMMRERNL